MSKDRIWSLARALEGLGLIVVLIGLFGSVQLGMNDQGLESQRLSLYGLLIGLALFTVGVVVEKVIGTR